MAAVGLPPCDSSHLIFRHQGRTRSMVLHQLFRSVGANAGPDGRGGGDEGSEPSSPTPSARLRGRSSNLSDALAKVSRARRNSHLMGEGGEGTEGGLLHVGYRSGEAGEAGESDPVSATAGLFFLSPFALQATTTPASTTPASGGSGASASVSAAWAPVVPVRGSSLRGGSGGAGGQEQQQHIGGNGSSTTRAGGGGVGGGGRNGSGSSGSLNPASSGPSVTSYGGTYGAAYGPQPPSATAPPSSSSGSSTKGGGSSRGARGRRWSVVSGTSPQSSPLSVHRTNSGSVPLALGSGGSSVGGGGGGDQLMPGTRTSASQSSNGSGGGGFSGGVNRQNSLSMLTSMAATAAPVAAAPVIPTAGSVCAAAPAPPRSPTHRPVERAGSGLGLAGLLLGNSSAVPSSGDSVATGGTVQPQAPPTGSTAGGTATVSSAAQQLQAYAARRCSLRAGRGRPVSLAAAWYPGAGGGDFYSALLTARRSLDDDVQRAMQAVRTAGVTTAPNGTHREPGVRRVATFSTLNNQPDDSGGQQLNPAAAGAAGPEGDGREFSTGSTATADSGVGSVVGVGGRTSAAAAAGGGRGSDCRMSVGRVSGRSSAGASSSGPFFHMMALLKEQSQATQAQARPPPQ